MKNHIHKNERRCKKMEQEFKGTKPDFKGRLEVAAWVNTDNDGKAYLSIVLGNRITLFKNEQKLDDQYK